MPDSRSKTADVLIAGAGIAGLLLARELRGRGVRVLIADNPARSPASRIAAGLINPVMGRRCALAWRAETALPFARQVYHTIVGGDPPRSLFRQLPIVRVFANAGDRALWESRAGGIAAAGFATRELVQPPEGLRDHGYGAAAIDGGGVVDAPMLIDVLRGELLREGALIEEACHADALRISRRGVEWNSQRVSAGAIVLAGGGADVDHPQLRAMKLRPVKGELLIVRSRRPSDDFAAVGSHYLVPDFSGRWVCGATQIRGDSELHPTATGRLELENALGRMLEGEHTIEEQRVGIRVMTPDMRPIVGPVAPDSCVHVLQGLGSRGYSLAPWCARALADQLVSSQPVPAEIAAGRIPAGPTKGNRWNAVSVSHHEARRFVDPGDIAIDLTVGNGGDTEWLAGILGPSGTVFGFDMQSGALAAAQRRLNGLATSATVRLIHASHAAVKDFVPPSVHGRVALALANLGYWPGSDSEIVTRPATTLPAFAGALDLLRPAGALVAVVYTGHEGGIEERRAIEQWAGELSPTAFEVRWLSHPGSAPRAPCVLVVTKWITVPGDRPRQGGSG